MILGSCGNLLAKILASSLGVRDGEREENRVPPHDNGVPVNHGGAGHHHVGRGYDHPSFKIVVGIFIVIDLVMIIRPSNLFFRNSKTAFCIISVT